MNEDAWIPKVYLKICKECGLPYEDIKLRGHLCEECRKKEGL